VAQRLAAYQAGVQQRLRQAELDRTAALVTAAEERKRQRLAVGLAAAVLGLVALGAGGGLWAQRVGARRRGAARRQRPGVEAGRGRLPRWLEEGRWKEGGTVLGEAERHLGEAGPADLVRRVGQARADLLLVAKLDNIRQKRATIAGGYFDPGSADRDYAAA